MTENLQAGVYLVPLPIGTDSPIHYHTPYLLDLIPKIKYWVAENARTLRRYISSLKLGIDIDTLEIFESNQHTAENELNAFLSKLEREVLLGVVSEAGIPCLADPGNRVVAWAHRKNIRVVPLIGPNSIAMALESSGMNGQQYIFHGYPPIQALEQKKWLTELFSGPWQKYTHSFIETPYRNNKMLEDLVSFLDATTHIGVACDITLETEFIKTQTVLAWKKSKIDLHKRPTIFIIHKDA